MSNYLYLMRQKNLTKIGITDNIKERLSQIRYRHGKDVKVSLCLSFKDNRDIEKRLHRRFSAKRHVFRNKKDREWFCLSLNDIIWLCLTLYLTYFYRQSKLFLIRLLAVVGALTIVLLLFYKLCT